MIVDHPHLPLVKNISFVLKMGMYLMITESDEEGCRLLVHKTVLIVPWRASMVTGMHHAA